MFLLSFYVVALTCVMWRAMQLHEKAGVSHAPANCPLARTKLPFNA
jgi:hypothetical protein